MVVDDEVEIRRLIESDLETALTRFPVVGLVGSRQVGKTTLARAFCMGRDILALGVRTVTCVSLAKGRHLRPNASRHHSCGC